MFQVVNQDNLKLIDDISTFTKALNECFAEAAKAGIGVQVEHLQAFGAGGQRPVITVRVFQEYR